MNQNTRLTAVTCLVQLNIIGVTRARTPKECKLTEEENIQSVTTNIEEVAQPSESEQQQDGRQDDVQPAPSPVMTDQDRNWREARRKMQELERRTADQDELIRRLQTQQQPTQEDDLAKLADDDIVTAKQARSLAQKMAREVADQAIREREATTIDERLRNKFPDYENVVTQDNIDLLKQQDPELAMSLYALANNPYEQAVAAYKMLKRTGLGDMAKTQPQKAKALENSKKPVSVQSVTKSSAIGEVHKFENGLTPEVKKQLWQEMQDARKLA